MPTQSVPPLALVSFPAASHRDGGGDDSVIPPDIQAILDLFEAHLANVQFPDVDATSLFKLAADVRTESKAVAHARATLAAAVSAMDARLAALVSACGRAIAYATIFSQAQPERQPIADAIAALTRPTAPAPTTMKRRGRPPGRAATKTVELFEAPIKPCEVDPAR